MASRQEIHVGNAEAEARVAVQDLSHVNKERRRHEERTMLEHEAQNKGSGILGSILKSVGDTYEQVKEAVASKNPEIGNNTGKTTDEHKEYADDYTAEKTKQTKDTVVGEVDEYVDSAVKKAEETKDSAMDKAREYKDYTALQKAGEYKDHTAQKTKEETDVVADRMAELKESAAVAARRAMDFFTGKTGEIDRKALEGGDMNEEKYGETEFVAREKMEELKLKEEGVYDEAKQRAAADWETAADRGIAARRNIYGAVGSVKEAVKDKLTYPTDIVS